MTSSKRLIVVGAVTLFVGLLATFPSRLLYRWFEPDAVQATGISGSVWSGSAAEGVVSGVYFRNLDWRLRPLSLLTGKLAFTSRLELAGGFIEADVATSISGAVTVRNLNAAFPLAAFDRIVLLNGLQGDLSLQLERADLVDGWPTRLQGTLGVSNLLIRNLASTPIGNYRAEFQTTDDAIVGSVEDTGGILELAGSLRLTPDRSYSLIGQVGAKDGAPSSVTRQLRFLGSPDARGLREFRFEGSL